MFRDFLQKSNPSQQHIPLQLVHLDVLSLRPQTDTTSASARDLPLHGSLLAASAARFGPSALKVRSFWMDYLQLILKYLPLLFHFFLEMVVEATACLIQQAYYKALSQVSILSYRATTGQTISTFLSHTLNTRPKKENCCVVPSGNIAYIYKFYLNVISNIIQKYNILAHFFSKTK